MAFIDIPGYEGLYQVSTTGKIRSLSKDVKCSQGFRTTKDKILSTKSPKGCYETVCLVGRNGKRKAFKVHQVVAMAFLGHKPNGYRVVVDHIDGNPKNNNVKNLQIITQRENCQKDKHKYWSSSKYVGVKYKGGNYPFHAHIRINGSQKFIGKFKTEKEANSAYMNEANKDIEMLRKKFNIKANQQLV